MYANFNDNRFSGHREHDRREDFNPDNLHRMGSTHGMGPARTMPRGFDSFEGGSARCMPRRFGGPNFGGPGDPGFPPHGMGPGFPVMPPHGMGPGRGGRPPRRPDPRFLRQRVEDADLPELIDMAGRMLRRRPQGGPAQGQALVLSILLGREALSQRELQQLLGIQPGSLSELVSKLEAKGFITREKAEDRRGNLLRITDAGRQAATAQAVDTPEVDPFAPLTADQQDQLAASLRILLGAWVDELGEEPGTQKPVVI